jgi:hypothetical protein
MFRNLKRFLKRGPPPVAEHFQDPILGTLTWSEDDKAWVSSATDRDVGFRFQISGIVEPDKALLAHAADILQNKDDFIARVMQCVRSEAELVRSLRPYRDEIDGLRVERVCLFWPNRPDDGMIFLSGGRDYRLWRCDYIARQPKGLGFDA